MILRKLLISNKFNNKNMISKNWKFNNNDLININEKKLNCNFINCFKYFQEYKINIKNNSYLISKFTINDGYLEFLLNFNKNYFKNINLSLFNDDYIIDIFNWNSINPKNIENYSYNEIDGHQLIFNNSVNLDFNSMNKIGLEIINNELVWYLNNKKFFKFNINNHNLQKIKFNNFNLKINHISLDTNSNLFIENFSYFQNLINKII